MDGGGIETDHAPHALAEKEAGLVQAPFGVVGLETALAVLLTELVHRGAFALSELIAALTSRPAKVLGIPRGTLKVGSAADVVMIDPQADWVVDAGAFASKSHNSPFIGWRVKGRVTDVLVNGRWRYRNGQFVNGEAA